MRTTVNINDTLMREAKHHAASEGITLREVIETALRAYLRPGRARRKKYVFKWKTEHGRLRPGVNIDDRDVLYEVMEGRK